MDEIILRKNKFKSPEINPRHIYNNSHRVNNYFLPDNDSDLYNDIIDTNINNTNYINNMRRIQSYKNKGFDNKLYNIEPEQEYNSDITNYFMNINNNVKLMKQENICLQKKIRMYKKQVISKDNEIENYKQKVRCLLSQVQDKNQDIKKKRNAIIKLSEVKDIFQSSQTPTNNMRNNNEIYTLKLQLQLVLKEKEKYLKQIKYLTNLIQKMNKNSIKQGQMSNRINNNKNQESEKSYEYNDSNNNNTLKNNFHLNFQNEDLKMTSFVLQINGFPKNNLENLIEENNDYIDKFEGFKKKKEIELNNLMKELEEKNILLKKKEKIINDFSLNLKVIKEENNNLKINLNKRIVELNEYKLKYDDEKNMDSEDKKIEMDLIVRENKELKNKFNSIEEEKINSERKIEELNEDIENLKEANDNLKKQLNEKNNIVDKINQELNNLKEKQNDLEKINEENTDLKEKLEKINQEYDELKIQNKQLTNKNNELVKKIVTTEENYNNSQKEIIDIKMLNTELLEKLKNNKEKESKSENIINNNEIKDLKKENDVLQKRVIQLNNLIEELNTQINELNIKYSNIKKENLNLKEASQAILEKQKQDIEQKDKLQNISPETHYIITKKTYNKLIWYLISIINPNDKNLIKNSGYEMFKWVPELSIPKSQLSKYNKFEDDETKINDLYDYIKKLQDKLEQKTEELSKRNYENQKLNDKLQNKSSNIKVGKLFLTKVLNNDKSNNNNANKSNSNQNTIKNNANSYLSGNNIGDMEKYKNLLDKLNDYDEREKKFINEISRLKSQLKDRENLQSGMKDINNIPSYIDSLGDDLVEKKVIDLLSNENDDKKKEKNKEKDDENFLGILNDVPGSEGDLDEVKGLKDLNNFLKKCMREKDKIIDDLLEQVKEIIKQLNWTVKNNKIVTKILTILGYTPEVIKIVTDNKKGFNFDFKLELKK